jgi:hypothetical protein
MGKEQKAVTFSEKQYLSVMFNKADICFGIFEAVIYVCILFLATVVPYLFQDTVI